MSKHAAALAAIKKEQNAINDSIKPLRARQAALMERLIGIRAEGEGAAHESAAAREALTAALADGNDTAVKAARERMARATARAAAAAESAAEGDTVQGAIDRVEAEVAELSKGLVACGKEADMLRFALLVDLAAEWDAKQAAAAQATAEAAAVGMALNEHAAKMGYSPVFSSTLLPPVRLPRIGLEWASKPPHVADPAAELMKARAAVAQHLRSAGF